MNTGLELLRSEIREMKRSVDFSSKKISDFEEFVMNLRALHKLVDDLRSENKHLREKAPFLNFKMNYMDQHTKSNSVEIQDIPESEDQDLFQIVYCIGNFLGPPFKKEKIDNIIRISIRIPSKPKHIIVKFESKLDRDELLEKPGINVFNLITNV